MEDTERAFVQSEPPVLPASSGLPSMSPPSDSGGRSQTLPGRVLSPSSVLTGLPSAHAVGS